MASVSGQPSQPSPLFLPPKDITLPTPCPFRVEFGEESTGERISLRLIDAPGISIPVDVHKRLVSDASATSDAKTSSSWPISDELLMGDDLIALADSYSEKITRYIDAQYEATLVEESKVRRNPKSPDFTTHAILYILDPQLILACRGLTPIDKRALRTISNKANVIPCFGKGDTITVKQLNLMRSWVAKDIQEWDIPIFSFPEVSLFINIYVNMHKFL